MLDTRTGRKDVSSLSEFFLLMLAWKDPDISSGNAAVSNLSEFLFFFFFFFFFFFDVSMERPRYSLRECWSSHLPFSFKGSKVS